MKPLWACLVGLAALVGSPALARDYGQQGAVFAVVEPDFLRTIQAKLTRLEQSGEITRMNEEFARRSEAKVRRPVPVVGVGFAVRPRTWTYDPGMTLDHDVSDTKGNLIAKAGQRVNPLDLVTVRQAMVFIDGDVPEQVEWALGKYTDANAKIIMVKGAPLEAMTRYQRRFYFDQGGFLIGRFGIQAVPAVVEQNGRVMRVSEIPVGIGRR
ncbi:MAG: type-F conjugative transfer system protein TraW [Betaproteobacteria bacterium]|nr:type-F conjugative transfer system protein TraW [Betaproteobacteria bacterium]